MKKCMIMVCLSVMLVSGIVSSAHADTVETGFFFDGVDLDTGAVDYDRTILVILMGETIEDLLRPNRAYLADFSPSVDVSFEWDPAEANLFDLILQDDVKIAVLEDTSFDTVESIMPGEFEFTAEPYSVSIDSDDLVLAWTAEDRSFKLGGFRWSDWTLQFEFEELNIIPEPSTFLLLGLGLIGVVGLVRRKKHLVAMLTIMVLASLWGAEIANAQPTSLITIKKEGPGNGTIVVGDQECDPACMEMSVPYVDKRAVILKVVPDEDSYFVRWKTVDGSSSEGTLSVQPGDTVIAVFGAKWVPFDPTNPVETPTPPEIQVPVSTLQEVVVDVDFPGMHVGLIEEEGKAYQHLYVPGSGHTITVGEPQVPMLGRFIALPADANVSVEVLESSFQELEEYMIYPAQEPLPDIEGASVPPFTIDSNLYQQDAFYPSSPVELEGPFIIRGTSVVILRMFPVQFNPVQRMLRVYSNLRVKVGFDGGKDYFIEDRVRSSSFDDMLNNLLLNAGTALFSETTLIAASAPPDNNGSLLIITPPDFLDAANTLADWKIQKGIPTKVRTTDETGDTASAIQQYIRNAYNSWDPPPAYVLLIGDAEFIPCHYKTWHPYNSDLVNCNNCQGNIGTDLYYATVDGTDYLPDISIGRLSVDTVEQANRRVNAIITYEKNPAANPNFYTSATVAAYFQDRNPKDGFADRRFALTSEDIRDYLDDSGYTVDRIYFTESDDPTTPVNENVNPTNWSNNPRYWPGTGADIPSALQKPTFSWDGDDTDITNAVNAGRFLLTHRDHGGVGEWGEPHYETVDVQALTNGNELPVVWSINCQTGWFDNETDDPSPDNTLFDDIHFSEAWERNANGGAIGVIAATRVSYSGHNDRLAWGLMDAIWPSFDSSSSYGLSNNSLWEMGAVLNYGKLYLAEFYPVDSTETKDTLRTKIEFEMFHWFGDPTMQIWTGAPQTLNVSHLSTLSAGSSSIDITVNQADALICISKNGVILGKALSINGTTTISWSTPLTVGETIQITVSKHDFRPYEGTADVPSSSDACQVTNENDSGAGSLRQVLADAGSNGCTTITFTPGVSRITLSSQLEIPSGTLTIDGGASGVIVSGNNSTRVFYVNSGADVTFQNLTITQGRASGLDSDGGGIYNPGGTVTIASNTIVSGNTATGDGGGISNGGTLIINGTVSGNTADEDGGGIENYYGTVTIANGATISGNTTGDDGGGLHNYYGTVTVASGAMVSDNTAEYYGGGIYNNSWTFTVNGIISGNTAGWDGGGIYTSSTFTGIPDYGSGNTPNNCAGFGCPSDPCQVTNNDDSGNGSLRQVLADAESNGCTVITFASGVSTITLNSQLEIPSRLGPLTIDGGGNVTISGNNSTRVFYVGWEADVTFQNLTITQGKASGSGNNAYGGGIYNNCGTVTLGNGATISDNMADDAGGGICNGGSSSSSIYSCGTVIIKNGALVSNNQARDGGGIYNRYPSSTLTIENGARINYNMANREGGGIFNSGTTTISGTVSGNSADDGGGIRTNGELIVDGTVSGNTAAWNGGGIWNSDGTVSIWSNGTVSGNTADGDGGGIFNYGNTYPADAKITVWGLVDGNTANRGGGIRNKGGIVIIRGTVRSNEADYGGGIFQSNDGFSTRVQRFEVFGTISSNTATYDGGGIWVKGSNSGPKPNYISSDGKIINNNALNGKGGGIYDYASTILGADSGTIYDNTASSCNNYYADSSSGGFCFLR